MPETTSKKAKITLPSDEQILITREFDAPKHLVYRAYTTPELVRRWWSGHRGTTTDVEIDLRVGGRWRYVITANGGFQVAFHGEYREIVPDERLVMTEVFEQPGTEASDVDAADDAGAPVNTITFTEVDGRTTLSILVQTSGKELRDTILGSGMEIGMQEQMNVLEEIAISLAAE
ncbi:SRPBCC family protein [Amycolatopsis sp. NPDC059021]|uniref:SRPBCC family protein n=1 Tax=Amycolatopsis sp. NPDC059021 TaxID=3346704 RepID=UPI003671667C